MIRKIPDDVQFEIDAKVASGDYADEGAVLREAMASLREYDEDVEKVQAAIDDWQSGDQGMPLDEAAALVKNRVENRQQ